MNIRVLIVYIVKNCVLRKVDNIPSNPIVGNIKSGTGENIFNANAKSGFFKIKAIGEEKANNMTENIPPNKKNKLVNFLMRFFASFKGTLGKK